MIKMINIITFGWIVFLETILSLAFSELCVKQTSFRIILKQLVYLLSTVFILQIYCLKKKYVSKKNINLKKKKL